MDVAAKYILKMPAIAKLITPSHPMYEVTQAIVGGDEDITSSFVTDPSFHARQLAQPLDSSGVTLLHVAAMANRPHIMHILLRAADAATATQSEMAKLQTRKEALYAKINTATENSGNRQSQLDALDRLMHIASEQQLLELVSLPDVNGRTVLHYAAAARGVMVDEGLFGYQSKRFTTAISSDGHTPLFPPGAYVDPKTGELWSVVLAPEEADLGPPNGYIAVSKLMQARNDTDVIDARDVYGATPLVYATVVGDLHAIRGLIEHGADPFITTADGVTPLDLAANRIIRAALVPLDSAVQSACGIHAVRAGVKPKFPGATEVLSPARAATGTLGVTSSPLRSTKPRSSTTMGSPGFVDRDSSDKDALKHTAPAETSPMSEAALLLLVNSGEDINGRTGIHLRSPLHMAAEAAVVAVVELLLNNGALVDIVDVNGCTPLHLAAELGTPAHQQVVKLLAEAGANVNATSSLRKSPLHMAATGGPHFSPEANAKPVAASLAVVSSSGEGGAGEMAVEAPAHPSFLQTHDGNAAMIRLLVDIGAQLEAMDAEGNTPLLSAAKRGNYYAVDTLLTLGSRIYSQNIRGHTALHLAAFHHQIPVVRQLTRWDAEVGRLKYILDTSGRSAYDMAADPPTRDALHTLFEACASGRLDLAQSVARAGSTVPIASVAPWLPVRPFEVTRVLRRGCLHAAVTGAAKALSRAQAKAMPSREAIAPAHGSSKRARVNPSAIHTVAGIGLRFTNTPCNYRGGVASDVKARWGGNPADVDNCFYEPVDADVALRVDPLAYVLPESSTKAKKSGDAKGNTLAERRMVPGTELTSSTTEKEFGRVVDWLIKSGCDVNDKDLDGVTPAMLAARYGLLYLLRKLLTRGADVSTADRHDNTALHYAYAFKHLDAVSIIEEFATDSLQDMRNIDGKTALEVAAAGMAILRDSSETLLSVPKPLPKSASLVVSSAM